VSRHGVDRRELLVEFDEGTGETVTTVASRTNGKDCIDSFRPEKKDKK
jgi:hypothetical protein